MYYMYVDRIIHGKPIIFNVFIFRIIFVSSLLFVVSVLGRPPS